MNNRLLIAQEFADSINCDDINQIILFGSVARDEDNADSDIDILIVSPIAKDIEPEIDKKAVDIILEKNELISAHVMSEEHFNKTKEYNFLQNVLKEGIILG